MYLRKLFTGSIRRFARRNAPANSPTVTPTTVAAEKPMATLMQLIEAASVSFPERSNRHAAEIVSSGPGILSIPMGSNPEAISQIRMKTRKLHPHITPD